MGIFDGLPTAVADKPYLKEDLSRVDESWAAARFDSLPHVVHILTSKDREVEARYLKEQSEIIEDAVDEVVHAYHTGFNKAIQNYSQITHREEEIAPFVAEVKRNYIFGGICSSAGNASIKALVDMKSINLFGVQQICRNSIALEQALAAITSIDSESIQLRLDRVRSYYELLNMPFEALLAFITEHEQLFTAAEYSNLIKVKVPGKEIPADAEERFSEILSH